MVDLEDCTFNPAVNTSQSPKRDLKTYIRDQELFEMSKKRKISELREKQEINEEKMINETHISKGSSKLYKKVDRYR